jgi:hypothetical protein
MNGTGNKVKLYMYDFIYIVGMNLFPAIYYSANGSSSFTFALLFGICMVCLLFFSVFYVLVQAICNICVDEHKPLQRWPGIKTAISAIIAIPDVLFVGLEKLWIPFLCLLLWKTWCTWKYYRSLIRIREKILKEQLKSKTLK